MSYASLLARQATGAVKSLPAVKLAGGLVKTASAVLKAPGQVLGKLLGGQPSKAELRGRRLQRLNRAVATGDVAVIQNYAYGAHGGKGSRFGVVRRQAQAVLEAMKGPHVDLKAGTEVGSMAVQRGNATQAGFGGRAGSARAARRATRVTRRSAKRTARAGKRKPTRKLKFGSPAWRKKYLKPKVRRRRRKS